MNDIKQSNPGSLRDDVEMGRGGGGLGGVIDNFAVSPLHISSLG